MLHRIARTAYDRMAAKGDREFSEDAIVAIIFSAATVEAFLNELGELVTAAREGSKLHQEPDLHRFGTLMEEAVAAHASIRLKLLLAGQLIRKAPWAKGSEPYQSIEMLFDLRNAFMHLRPLDKFRTSRETSGSVEPPKLVGRLKKSLLARGDDLPWTERVATKATAQWACNTAFAAVNEILSGLDRNYSFIFRDIGLSKVGS